MPQSDASEETEFVEPDPDFIFETFARIGFVPPSDPADEGRPGLDFAGRSEIKLAALRPGEPIGVSGPMSADAKRFMQCLADHMGELQVVTDPTGTYVFELGKPVDHIPFEVSPPLAPKKPWWKLW